MQAGVSHRKRPDLERLYGGSNLDTQIGGKWALILHIITLLVHLFTLMLHFIFLPTWHPTSSTLPADLNT